MLPFGWGVPMGDEDHELQRAIEIERVAKGKPSHWDMDDAFCGRMRTAIKAGLENAPVGVVTTPGTQNPKLAGRYGALPSPLATTMDD
jgi:hypothetical protein